MVPGHAHSAKQLAVSTRGSNLSSLSKTSRTFHLLQLVRSSRLRILSRRRHIPRKSRDQLRCQCHHHFYSSKFCLAGSSIMYFRLQVTYKSYRQVLTPCQQFSAPFKAGNSRQAQTCYIPQKYNTKETQFFNWFDLV